MRIENFALVGRIKLVKCFVQKRDGDVSGSVVDARGNCLFSLPVPAEVLVHLAQEADRHMSKVEGAPVKSQLIITAHRFHTEDDRPQVVEHIAVGKLVDLRENSLRSRPAEAGGSRH